MMWTSLLTFLGTMMVEIDGDKNGKYGDIYITIFTDASFCHETVSTGYAIWIKHGFGDTITLSGSSSRPKNSTEAEILSLQVAIRYVEKNLDYMQKRLVIQCDNIGALECVTVPYEDHLLSVRRKHIKAHTNYSDKRSKLNNWCDGKAKKEMRQLRNEKRRKNKWK